ncbi:patatin-like phospholipase family protein [Wenyingzhuangia aestuarii]|uniref:patatin-like phospholipase family protein n=1 Tax=Wenyingzhuangia aestuarii TaxID=1647582 RepID=UPI0014388436|nr:patatin-like phospholipase family protein [Wenyingzhuangia aestuarii]NJB82771.1 NTE family protein [Wenyingzhuangia aestuarii]
MMTLKKGDKIGLALGGGAVLGAAHVGVLKAIEEIGLDIQCIAGTSIGAMVAGLYAFDNNCDRVKDIALEISWRDITALSISKYGLLSNTKIAEFIESNIGKVNIEDARIPLAINATDIANGNRVTLRKGSVAKAVMASSCIPGIFKPVTIDDVMLVDGAVSENVPISALEEMKATKIVAIDLNAKHMYGKPQNMIEVLQNSFHFTLEAAAKAQTQRADILITPDLSAFDRINTSQTERLIYKGYQEALKCFAPYLS